MLLDVLLDVDISALRMYAFLLEDPPTLVLSLSEVGTDLKDGPGGGIRARAEICFCIDTSREA